MGMKLTLFFCAIFALGAMAQVETVTTCVPATYNEESATWPAAATQSAENDAVFEQAKQSVLDHNKELYDEYTVADILNFKELAEKLVAKFEKIEQFKNL